MGADLTFVPLRDAFGITQIRFNNRDMDKEGLLRAKLTQESVVRVKGRVRMRPEQDRNPRMSTGEVEVLASEVEILNQASPNLPFTPTLKNSNVTEELRQKFRYIDLRRESMQHNIRENDA